ncbi:MAG: VOC family protein [Acidimicrobiales bacterium]
MLANAPVSAALPAKDFARARQFYSEVLGLPVAMEMGENVAFACGGGTLAFVYKSDFAGTNQATAAGWDVDDLDSVMAGLRERGVTFEDYDLPGLKTVDGVVTIGDNRIAYFKDTEGNILSLAQMG